MSYLLGSNKTLTITEEDQSKNPSTSSFDIKRQISILIDEAKEGGVANEFWNYMNGSLTSYSKIQDTKELNKILLKCKEFFQDLEDEENEKYFETGESIRFLNGNKPVNDSDCLFPQEALKYLRKNIEVN